MIACGWPALHASAHHSARLASLHQTSEELTGRSSELEAAQRRIDSLEREVDSLQRSLEVAGAAAAEEVSARIASDCI